MKSITEALPKLSATQKKELALLAGSRQSSDKGLVRALTAFGGLHSILKSLSPEELKILKQVYGGNDGITLGELEKKLHQGIALIEAQANNLTHRLLVYTIKNRQLLTNKMDKVYAIEEIAPFLLFRSIGDLTDHLKELKNTFIEGHSEKGQKPGFDEKTQTLLRFIATEGGIVSLEEVQEANPVKDVESQIEKALKEGYLSLAHVTSPQFNTFLLLTSKGAPALRQPQTKREKESIRVHNRYRMVLNLLRAYDIISTYGLFLTKQKQFRKIDIRRLNEAMIPMKDLEGNEISPERLGTLSLFFLHALNCLKVKKEALHITLKALIKDFEHPQSLVVKVLHCLDSEEKEDPIFPPGETLPPYRLVQSLLKALSQLGETELPYLTATLLTDQYASAGKKSLIPAIEGRNKIRQDIATALDFLGLMGLVQRQGTLLSLSDVGWDTVHRLYKIKGDASPPETGPAIYINPDFTLIMPERELSSLAQYSILTHTSLENDDVILHALITRESIVRAQKRGLALKNFLETLKVNSRNQIPQNLDFLLTEWSRQTMKIVITDAILLKTSHPDFLEEIIYSPEGEGIVERISPQYAIIDKYHLDDILKAARKKDAVISLFELENEASSEEL